MLRKIICGLADIIYPKRCLVCKAPLTPDASADTFACASCLSKIKKNLPPFCSCCGRHLKKTDLAKNICSACARKEFHFDRAFSPCLYEGTVKELLHEFKYKGKDYLGDTLAKPLVDFIKEYRLPLEYLDIIIPVPLHESKFREREFNQAYILGERVAREFNKEIRQDLLFRNRATKSQAEMQTHERAKNVRGCFAVAKPEAVNGKNVLLVDDVFTTGATCSEAAGALKKAGAKIVFAITLSN